VRGHFFLSIALLLGCTAEAREEPAPLGGSSAEVPVAAAASTDLPAPRSAPEQAAGRSDRRPCAHDQRGGRLHARGPGRLGACPRELPQDVRGHRARPRPTVLGCAGGARRGRPHHRQPRGHAHDRWLQERRRVRLPWRQGLRAHVDARQRRRREPREQPLGRLRADRRPRDARGAEGRGSRGTSAWATSTLG
jgi:hypothetical protein